MKALKKFDGENLEKTRQLKVTPSDPDEIANMIRSAERRLADAGNSLLSYESRFDINAAHALALAALRHHGYRSDSQYIVFQCLAHTLDFEARLWRLFDLAHRRRNIAEYEGDWEIDEPFLAELLDATRVLLEQVKSL